MISSGFKLSEIIKWDRGEAHYLDVLKHIYPLLTPERRMGIERVVNHRCFSVSVVLENIYDRGNISAVMRTAEGLGFSNFHIVEGGEKFKEANRVTQGTEKWLEIKKWKSSKSLIEELKTKNIQIISTTLQTKKTIYEVDFTKPTALVLGNEKDGVSSEMLEASDEKIIYPMPGFVQSFNISVAAALCLGYIQSFLIQKKGQLSDLLPPEKEILKSYYAFRSLDSAKEILESKKLAPALR